MRERILFLISIFGLAIVAWGQQPPAGSNTQPNTQQSMPGMDMSGHDMSNMKGMSMGADKDDKDADASAHVMHSMEGHMNMGPHMKMTPLRAVKPGDGERAEQVVAAARKVSAKYMDYHLALADGFKMLHPEVPQKMYHFTTYQSGFEAAFSFNPEHPTSLLYEKHGADYKLIGVMYTARKTATQQDLDARVPLSIAQWHAHVNLCVPPPDKKQEAWGPNSQFGLHGSITTEEACDAAGGTFRPQIFGWMVHVYPFQLKPED